MSVTGQHARDQGTAEHRDTDQRPLHDGYDTDAVVWRDTVKLAALAWVGMQYPVAKRSRYEEGTLLASENLIFRQRRDGFGWVEHKDDICAIRTPDGTVLSNTTCSPEDGGMHARFKLRMACRELGVDYYTTEFAFAEELIEAETGTEYEDFILGVEAITTNAQDRWTSLDDTASPGVMLHHESGYRVYVGQDPSSHTNFRVFGFVLASSEDAPTAEDTIDLLKPQVVARAQIAGKDVRRQGEWWLIPTDETPEGTVQKPGVAERAFGGSPLDNHVPRDWRTHVADGVFVERFLDAAAGLDFERPIETPQDVADLVTEKEDDPAFSITYHDIRTLADGICIQGSLRHRHNEHFMETVEGWHRAVTHDRQVWTADQEHQTITHD